MKKVGEYKTGRLWRRRRKREKVERVVGRKSTDSKTSFHAFNIHDRTSLARLPYSVLLVHTWVKDPGRCYQGVPFPASRKR